MRARAYKGLLVAWLMCVVLAVGSFGGLYVWRDAARGARIEPGSLAAVEGRIVAADVVARSVGRRRGPSYEPVIAYAFVVGGEERAGHLIAFRPPRTYGERSAAQAVVDRYSPGTNVTVFFDPSGPDLAVLDPTASDPGIFRFLFGLGVATAVLSLVGLLAMRLVRATGGIPGGAFRAPTPASRAAEARLHWASTLLMAVAVACWLWTVSIRGADDLVSWSVLLVGASASIAVGVYARARRL